MNTDPDGPDPLDRFDTFDPFADPSAPRARRWKSDHRPKRTKWEVWASLTERGDPALGLDGLYFSPAFDGIKTEKEWILEHLSAFHSAKQITGVLKRVKGGKEAHVYCCAAHPDTGLDLIAAKIYRPHKFRNLRNDSQYRQGRATLVPDGPARAAVTRDWRLLKAIEQKSRFGLKVQQTSWLEYEFQTLQQLYAAGADVPQPLKRGSHVLLMEYVGDEIIPAPTLKHVRLRPDEARPLFDRLLWNVERILATGFVHGDLSPYNVLYWEGEIYIIDFPQVADARGNPDAYSLFQRDVRRLCEYFARYGIESDPGRIAVDLWARHGFEGGPRTADGRPPTGDDEPLMDDWDD